MKTKGVILIVDNAPEFLDSLKFFLEVEGYTVYAADNPGDAKLLLADELIHLAVIDVRLTDDRDEDDWSGLHLATEAAPDVPKIILTGRRYEDPSAPVLQVLRPDKQGHILASDFVFKKEGPDKLLEAIEGAFQSKVRLNTEMEITWEKGLSWRVLVENIEAYREKDESEKRRAEEELEDLVVRLVDRATTLRMLRVISGREGCGVVIARPSFGRVMGEDMVIKFGPREAVMTEVDNYKRWVEPFAAVRSTQLRGEPVRTPRLGVIKYSFVGERLGRLVHFNDYYLREDVPIESIEETLRYLFEECCELWYKSKRKPSEKERIPLDVWYREQLPFYERHVEELQDVVEGLVNSEHPLARHFRRQEWDRLEVTLDGETIPLPDPVHFALEAKSSERGGNFFPVPSLVAITHGDLDGTNILVDGEGKAWLIDFVKTGWGPALRDLAELESVVKFELLQTDSLLARLDLERALLAPRMFDERVQFENRVRVPELDRAIATIQRLRELARKLTDTNDMYEYYIGLLFHALKEMAGFTPRASEEGHFSVNQYHALLSAAMICQKLQQREFSNAEITRRFFQQAGFAVRQLSDTSLSASYPTKGGWRRYGDMHILCVEGDVSGSDISAVASKAMGEGTLDGGLAFIVHSGKLVENATRQLWRLKKDGFIIVPLHMLTVKQALASRDPDECYRQLRSLRETWSRMVDPYESVDSVTDPQWFVGRDKLIREVMEHISARGGKQVVIWGMRRVGKTAVLNQIELACRDQGYPVVKWLCKEEPVELILRNIVKGFAGSVEKLYPRIGLVKVGSMDEYEQNAAEQFRTDLFKLWDTVRRSGDADVKLVLLLDELEINGFFPGERSSEEDYLRYTRFAQAIKDILERVGEAEALSLVVAAEYWWVNEINQFPYNGRFKNPLFQRFTTKLLTFLKPVECDAMVQRIGELAGLQYEPTSLKRIYGEARGHPQVTRWLCSCILRVMGQKRVRGEVTPRIVDRAVDYFLSDPGGDDYRSYFEQVFWQNPLSPDVDNDQRVLAELATRDPYPADELLPRLLEQFGTPEDEGRMQSTKAAIENAIERLVELSVVHQDRQRKLYRFRVPLYAKWIRVWKLGLPPKLRGGRHAS